MISINKKDKFTQLWLEHKLLNDYLRPAKDIAQYYHGKKVECTLKRTSGLRKIPWTGCYEVPPMYPQGLPANFRDTTQTFPSLATSPSTAASTLGPFCKQCGAQLAKLNTYDYNANIGSPRGGVLNHEANYAIVQTHNEPLKHIDVPTSTQSKQTYAMAQSQSEPLKDNDFVPTSTPSKPTTTNDPTSNEVIQNQCLVLQALTHYKHPPASCCGNKCPSSFDDIHHTKTDVPDQKDQHDRNHDDEIYALAISNSPETCSKCIQEETRHVLKSGSKHVHHNKKNTLCTNCGVFFNPKERVNQELLVYIEEDQSSTSTLQSQTKEVPVIEKEITPEPERRSTLKSFWDAFVPTTRKKVSNDSLLQVEESVAKENKYSDCIVTTSHCLQLLLDRDTSFSKSSSENTSEYEQNSLEKKNKTYQRRYKGFNMKKLFIPSNSSFDNIYNYGKKGKAMVLSNEEVTIKTQIRSNSTKPKISQEKGHRKGSESRKTSECSDGEEMAGIKICYGKKANPFDCVLNKNRKSKSRKYQLFPKKPPKKKSKKSLYGEHCSFKNEECLCNKNAKVEKKSQEIKGIEIEICSSDPVTIPITKQDKIREHKRLSQLLEKADDGCTCGINTPNGSKSSISRRVTIFDESKKQKQKTESVHPKSALSLKDTESEQSVHQNSKKFKLSRPHFKTNKIIKLSSKGTSTDPIIDDSDKTISNISSDLCIYSSMESISINSVEQMFPVSTGLLTESGMDSITVLSQPHVSIDLQEKLLKYDRKCNDFSSENIVPESTQLANGTKIIKKGHECETKSEKLSNTNHIEKVFYQRSNGRVLNQFCANFPDINSCGGLGRIYNIPKAVKNNNGNVEKVVMMENFMTTSPKKFQIQMCPHGSSMNIIHEVGNETSESSWKECLGQKESKNCCTPLTEKEKQSKRNDFWICHMRDRNENAYKSIGNSSDNKIQKKIEFLTKRKHFLHSSSCACTHSFSSNVYPTMNILPPCTKHSQGTNRAINLATAIKEIDKMSLDNYRQTENPQVYTCFCKHFAEIAQDLVDETTSSSESINTDDLDRNPQTLESLYPGIMTNLEARKDVDVVSLIANILGVKHPLVQAPEIVLRKPRGYSMKKDLEQIDEKKKINLQRLEEKVLLDMEKLDMEMEKRKALVGTLKQKIVEEKQRLDEEKVRLNRRNSELEKTDPLTGEVTTEKQQSLIAVSKKENKKISKKNTKKDSKQESQKENQTESTKENENK